ncbi:MAG: HNH endonuclease [Mycobacteriaceae bacterium]
MPPDEFTDAAAAVKIVLGAAVSKAIESDPVGGQELLRVGRLEACHLYSYAEIGRHDIEGGLLLRRDLHRLFDQGLLAITRDGTIDVADSLKEYDLYSGLHGQNLKVTTTGGQREWLALHWAEWRSRAYANSPPQ